jgi:hypothetical protein
MSKVRSAGIGHPPPEGLSKSHIYGLDDLSSTVGAFALFIRRIRLTCVSAHTPPHMFWRERLIHSAHSPLGSHPSHFIFRRIRQNL